MRLVCFIQNSDARFVPTAENHIDAYSASSGFNLNVTFVSEMRITFREEMLAYLADNKFDGAIVCDYRLLPLFVFGKKFKAPGTDGPGVTLNDYNLSFIKSANILICNPLVHLRVVPYGAQVFKRGLSKFNPLADFADESSFTYEVSTDVGRVTQVCAYFATASHIAIDIETGLSTRLKSIAFSGYIPELKRTLNVSWPINQNVSTLEEENVLLAVDSILRNDSLKIFQNGMFDVTVLLYWNLPVKNWYFDTYGMFHAWLAEMPRDLGFIAQFCIRDILYWKDEGASDLLKYNAKDAWATLQAFNYLALHMPQWAHDNFTVSFPLVFPCMQANLTGVKVDLQHRAILGNKAVDSYYKDVLTLNTWLGKKFFNVNSPNQVVSLLQTLAPKAKFKSSDKSSLDEFANLHPFNAEIVELILSIRKAAKLQGAFITAPLINGRLLYNMNPFGTESGRFSCSASSLYEKKNNSEDNDSYIRYGVNIQTIPPKFKVCIQADEGYLLVEMDKSASETYCTGFLANDKKLIKAVSTSPDFHSFNGQEFFGISAEEIMKEAAEKKKTGEFSLRDLAKRVNHGANYNMGWSVLASTMGQKKLWLAKSLLKLPEFYSVKEIAEDLLLRFEKAYPVIRGRFQQEIKHSLKTSKALTSPIGWKRLFFGDVDNKLVLNAAIAHGPQNLSVSLVNRGYLELWLKYRNDSRVVFLAQIHDSILFQIRKDSLDLLPSIKAIYDATAIVEVRGNLMTIPSTISEPKKYWK